MYFFLKKINIFPSNFDALNLYLILVKIGFKLEAK